MAHKKSEEWLTETGLIRIEGWARDGLSEEQISHNMGISSVTLRSWKKKFPSILSAIKKGKQPIDYRVENAMLKSALGYTAKIKKAIKLKEEGYDERGKRWIKEHIEFVEEEVHVPANTIAQIFWLKNRKPKQWRDKQIVEADTTTLEKLDSILATAREQAENGAADNLEYLSEEDVIQQEAAGIHQESE